MNRFLITAATTLLVASPALAQSVFLDDATLIDADGTSRVVDIQIDDGIITSLAQELTAPEGADLQAGRWVSSGLFAPISTLGIVDIGAESDTNDIQTNTDLASVSLKVSDSFNPRETHIDNARRRGIMFAGVVPFPTGDRIFAGTGLVTDLSGSADSIIGDRAFIHIALGEAGARRSGGSRAGAIAQLRGALDDARRSFQTQDEGDVLRRRDARAFRSVVSGTVPLMISASRASDLSKIIELKAEFPALNIIIVGAEEAHLVAEDLADADIKVIVDPLENLPDSFDSLNASFDNVVILDAAGVDYAISSLSSFRVVKAGALAQHAGNAVAQGLSREAAMQAITTTPAAWFDVDLGDIRTGLPATLVIWDGDPLEATSAPVAMYKDGDALSLESRMTALRDRYNPTNVTDLPHKYR